MQDQTPVKVSGAATAAIAKHLRKWSGWPTARLTFGDTEPVSPWALTNLSTKEFRFNIDALLLNPNRVLNTVTPFRLKQEAVLTGAMLHEVGHARYSQWMLDPDLRLPSGEKPSDLTVWLARTMEEARIEALIARDADEIGALGYVWTMRATAAHLLPTSPKDFDSTEVALLHFIQSWLLRAGRRHAMNMVNGVPIPGWVIAFDDALHDALRIHMTETDNPLGYPGVVKALGTLKMGVSFANGANVLAAAAQVVEILFPETEPEPLAGGCHGSDSRDEGDGDESEGEGDESGEGEGEGQGEGEGASGSTGSALAKVLAEAEAEAEKGATETDAQERDSEEAQAKVKSSGAGAGGGSHGVTGASILAPGKNEREFANRAERFLKDLLDPGLTATVSLSDSPSASVDAKALAVYRATQGRTEPKFFRRHRREERPTPPVKIAVLVDVSSSMDVLQAPSAVLSWALASAAVDLRNFAGRGQKIESTLIHWGVNVYVVQKPGQGLPGIPSRRCTEGTRAMGEALAEVEKQIPGFFDPDPEGKPENRLLIQFTDWELFGDTRLTEHYLHRAVTSGVKMLTVLPPSGSFGWASKMHLVEGYENHKAVPYNPSDPHGVWDAAAQVLR